MGQHFFATGTDGTRLHVRTQPGSPGGRAPAAVFCDGIACDGFIWKYLWHEVARVAPVAHWNYRGHGRSGPPADPERVELVDHARDLEVVRRAIGDPPVVLFGHSMGCQVALEGYRLRPEGVRGLVLICGASGRITHTFKGTDMLAQVLPGIIERVDAHRALARAVWGRLPASVALKVGRLMGDFDATIDVADLVPYLDHMVDIDLPMFLRMLRSAGEHSAVDLLPTIDAPALVIAGDCDSFTPPRYAEEMAAAMPRGELLMLPGATHVAPLERKDVVHERILRFLREREGD
jgi:pimeloyl-ACP methyl ester carboxylesterase